MELDSTTPSYVQPALRALYKDENIKRCGAQLAVASNEEELCYVTAAYDDSGEELSHLRRFVRCGSRAARLYAVAHKEAVRWATRRTRVSEAVVSS